MDEFQVSLVRIFCVPGILAPASKVGLNDLVGLHGRESDEDDPEEDEEPGRDDLDELRASEFSSGHLRMSADEHDEDGDLLGKK